MAASSPAVNSIQTPIAYGEQPTRLQIVCATAAYGLTIVTREIRFLGVLGNLKLSATSFFPYTSIARKPTSTSNSKWRHKNGTRIYGGWDDCGRVPDNDERLHIFAPRLYPVPERSHHSECVTRESFASTEQHRPLTQAQRLQ